MAGRPRKKPEYNPELQFNNFLQELRDAYEEADSLRSLADELNISLLKLRKLLITADVFTSDICTEINDLHQSGKKIPEIMKLTGLSRASVHSYLPYTKGLYNAAEISLNAESDAGHIRFDKSRFGFYGKCHQKKICGRLLLHFRIIHLKRQQDYRFGIN